MELATVIKKWSKLPEDIFNLQPTTLREISEFASRFERAKVVCRSFKLGTGPKEKQLEWNIGRSIDHVELSCLKQRRKMLGNAISIARLGIDEFIVFTIGQEVK